MSRPCPVCRVGLVVRANRTCSRACRRVDAHSRLEQRFWSKVDKSGGPDACWPWMARRLPKGGYGQFSAKTAGNGNPRPASRWAWEFINGAIPQGLFVLHRCDNPPCCNPTHLFLGTPKANMDDMWAKGRAKPPHGEQGGTARLTEADVLAIRAAALAGETVASIARRYGVGATTIWAVKHGRSWKHITAEARR